jgi:uncharacterized protein YtpQ (UPF0354 family)
LGTRKIPVAGDVVAAVPARGFLLVAGSKDATGLQKITVMAHSIAAHAPYRLTDKLFVYRNALLQSCEPDAIRLFSGQWTADPGWFLEQ